MLLEDLCGAASERRVPEERAFSCSGAVRQVTPSCPRLSADTRRAPLRGRGLSGSISLRLGPLRALSMNVLLPFVLNTPHTLNPGRSPDCGGLEARQVGLLSSS